MQATTTVARLQTLRRQLDQCRAAGKRAVFPEELKRQAVSLSQEYPSGVIVNALAISPTSLSRWKQQVSDNDDRHSTSHYGAADNSSSFITLPTANTRKPDTYPLSIVLNGTDNDQKITFNGEITIDQWRDILGQISQVLMS